MRVMRGAVIALMTLIAAWTAFFAVGKWRLDSAAASLLSRLPRTEIVSSMSMNGTAQQIARASASIGFPVTIRTRSTRRSATTQPRQLEVRKLITEWVTEQTESRTPELTPLPIELETFLASNEEKLRSLDEAVDSGIAIWDFDAGATLSGPTPDLLSHITIVRLYGARALAAERRGSGAEAWEHLRRASALADALTHRPQLIANLIALAEIRSIAQWSLRLTTPPPAWAREFVQRDVVTPLIRSEVHDASTIFDSLIDEEFGAAAEAESTLFGLGQRVMLFPVKVWGIRDYVVRRFALADSLASGGCSFGPAETSHEHALAVRLEIVQRELELARLVFAARAGQDLRPMDICGRRWRVTNNGSETVFSLPDDAPRHRMRTDVREFRLPLAPEGARPHRSNHS